MKRYMNRTRLLSSYQKSLDPRSAVRGCVGDFVDCEAAESGRNGGGGGGSCGRDEEACRSHLAGRCAAKGGRRDEEREREVYCDKGEICMSATTYCQVKRQFLTRFGIIMDFHFPGLLESDVFRPLLLLLHLLPG